MSEPFNPYEVPKVNLDTIQPENDYIQIGRGIRFLNYIIDLALILLFNFILGLSVGFLQLDIPDLALNFISYAIFVGYYIFSEYFTQKTLGKLITRTRVINMEGGRPRLTQIIGRSFARLVPFEVFSFFGSLGIGWHDRWSNTRVVRVAKKPKVYLGAAEE